MMSARFTIEYEDNDDFQIFIIRDRSKFSMLKAINSNIFFEHEFCDMEGLEGFINGDYSQENIGQFLQTMNEVNQLLPLMGLESTIENYFSLYYNKLNFAIEHIDVIKDPNKKTIVFSEPIIENNRHQGFCSDIILVNLNENYTSISECSKLIIESHYNGIEFNFVSYNNLNKLKNIHLLLLKDITDLSTRLGPLSKKFPANESIFIIPIIEFKSPNDKPMIEQYNKQRNNIIILGEDEYLYWPLYERSYFIEKIVSNYQNIIKEILK